VSRRPPDVGHLRGGEGGRVGIVNRSPPNSHQEIGARLLPTQTMACRPSSPLSASLLLTSAVSAAERNCSSSATAAKMRLCAPRCWRWTLRSPGLWISAARTLISQSASPICSRSATESAFEGRSSWAVWASTSPSGRPEEVNPRLVTRAPPGDQQRCSREASASLLPWLMCMTRQRPPSP
jgi:hypothetical protein